MKRAFAVIILVIAIAAPSYAANWLEHEDWAKAKEQSKKTGRPMAILFFEAGAANAVHNKQVDAWKQNAALDQFVCILVDMKKNIKFLEPLLLKTNDTRKEYIPMIFIVTFDEEVVELLHYDTDQAKSKELADAVVKKLGPFPKDEQAEAFWKKLEDARAQLAEQGKAGAAMKLYAELAALEKVNANLPILKEVKADAAKINAKGRELINQAKKLNTDGKTADAVTMLRQLAQAFQGYDAGKEAVDLGKQYSAKPAAPAQPAQPAQPANRRRPPVEEEE